MFKKVLSILILALVSSFSWGQNQAGLLRHADSLFAQQQFTQSFTLYDSIYSAQEEASPSMLLKMAYIKEGLNDITAAQYYLNEYYLITKNEQALQKMAELAKANELTGYEQNDVTFFYSLYYENYNFLLLGVVILCLLLFILIVYQKRKNSTAVGFNSFLFILLLAGLFILVNFGRDYNRGVVITNNSYVMAAPSSGADLIDVIAKGHKVVVQKKEDVWYKIEWQDQEAYIKAKNVKLLTVW